MGDVYSIAAARAKAVAVLELIPLPSGAVQLTASPDADLAGGPSDDPQSNLVAYSQWWSLPGSDSAFTAFLKVHPPAGFSPGAGVINSGSISTVNWAQFAPAGPTVASLQIRHEQHGDHVDLRLDATATWLIRRTPAETIPVSLTSATLDYVAPPAAATQETTPKPRHAHRVLTGQALQRIVSDLNAVPVGVAGPQSCPEEDGEVAHLAMEFGGHHVVFTVYFSGCGGVDVTSDSQPQPYLFGPRNLTPDLYAAVGVAITPIPRTPPLGPVPTRRAAQTLLLHNRVQAQRAGDAVVRTLLVLPDAVETGPVSHPPWPRYTGAGTLVDRAIFRTITGKRDDLFNWLRAHPPAGRFAAEPIKSSRGVLVLDMEPRDQTKPVTANIWVSMVQQGAQVVFRVDAQSAWKSP
ncbi:MAG: hypothetical protein QOJ11_3614 [Frankiales bacterium]|jgi:hypothetical protein|nr:hypothetical protein [Frankiales bacterium]